MNNTYSNILVNIEDNNSITNILGIIGTILTTCIYTPQIYKSYINKNVEVSWGMLIIEINSDIIWISYYYLSEIYLPILTGLLILTFASSLGFMKLYYNQKNILIV